MKVIIIGPGALGCLLAAKLSRGNEVWLLDHDAERAGKLAASGVLLEEEGLVSACPVRATIEAGGIGPADLALLCVKSHQIKAALAAAAPALRRTRLLLALPNGIGHLEILTEFAHGSCWGVGVTAQGATLAGPGRVIHRGAGITKIGLPPGASGSQPGASCPTYLALVAETLAQAGIPTLVVDDVLPHIWGKLLVNVGINALTAINRCPNGALLESPRLRAMMTDAVREGALVAARLGIELPDDPVANVLEVCRATAANTSSMLQDIQAGRRTEIEAINGALVRMAEGLGVEVPLNRELVSLVRDLERK